MGDRYYGGPRHVNLSVVNSTWLIERSHHIKLHVVRIGIAVVQYSAGLNGLPLRTHAGLLDRVSHPPVCRREW
jgi:hypothetical protein